MSGVITHNEETLKEILNRLDDSKHEIALYDLITKETIHIDGNLKKIIKIYYQDKLSTVRSIGDRNG